MSKAAQNISALTSAIDDIRHKLVEEPWFGQSTTDNIQSDTSSHDNTQNFYSFYNIDIDVNNNYQSSPAEHEQPVEHDQREEQHEQDL